MDSGLTASCNIKQVSFFFLSICFLFQVKLDKFNYCVVRENIHTPPTEDQWKFRGGGGFKGSYFQGVGGVHGKLSQNQQLENVPQNSLECESCHAQFLARNAN